jgi:hypothetical protein
MIRNFLFKYHLYDKQFFGVYYFILYIKSIKKNKQIHFFEKINNIMMILLNNINVNYGVKIFMMPCEKRKLTENIIDVLKLLKKDKSIDYFVIGVIIYYFSVNKFEDDDINLYCLFDFNSKIKKNIINTVNSITISNQYYASFIRRFCLGLSNLEKFEIL